MFIKRALAILSFCPLVLVMGCAKENVRAAKPVEVNLKGTGDCLSAFSDNLAKFQKGDLSNTQVDEFWGCVQKAVNDYQRLTAGDKNGDYSPHAVRRFFQRYFIKSHEIDDPLLMSIMEIKRILLSGNSEVITFEELTLLQNFISMLKEISLDLNPHVKVIFMHADHASDGEIERAGEVAERSILRLGSWLGQHSQAYSFAQMSDLVHNLRDFSNKDGEGSDIFENLDKAMTVLPSAKQILLNGRKHTILGDEWPRLTLALGQGYRSLLAARYSFKEDLNAALLREALPKGLVFVVDILERGALAHRQKEIPMEEWRELFDKVEATGWLPKEVTAQDMMTALEWAVGRMMGQGQGDPAVSLTPKHLRSLRNVLAGWNSLQERVAANAKLDDPIGKKFAATLAQSAPQEWDEEGRMAFPVKPAKVWSTGNKLRMVWPFVIMNWLKDSYVGPDQPEMDGDQMTTAASEVLTVLKSFGWMESTENSIGMKLLRESDLFTRASNGNGLIDVAEASRYLAFIASSFRAAELWLKESKTVCPDQEADCVRGVGADLDRDILTSMPRLKAWLAQKNTLRRFKEYSRAGEETILNHAVEGEFKTADLLQVWMIFQYVENFLQRFDQDFTETVSLPEADPAFKLFGPILEKLLSGFGLPEDELFGFFTFMMKYGDTPFTMYGGQVLYNHWKWHRNDWAFQSDRTQLMGILNQLSKL